MSLPKRRGGESSIGLHFSSYSIHHFQWQRLNVERCEKLIVGSGCWDFLRRRWTCLAGNFKLLRLRLQELRSLPGAGGWSFAGNPTLPPERELDGLYYFSKSK